MTKVGKFFYYVGQFRIFLKVLTLAIQYTFPQIIRMMKNFLIERIQPDGKLQPRMPDTDRFLSGTVRERAESGFAQAGTEFDLPHTIFHAVYPVITFEAESG